MTDRSFGKFTREQLAEFATMSAGEHLKFIRKVDPQWGMETAEGEELRKFRVQLYRKVEVTEVAEMDVWAISEDDAEKKADELLVKRGVVNGLDWSEDDSEETHEPEISSIEEV